jgi:hypothetical protein
MRVEYICDGTTLDNEAAIAKLEQGETVVVRNENGYSLRVVPLTDCVHASVFVEADVAAVDCEPIGSALYKATVLAGGESETEDLAHVVNTARRLASDLSCEFMCVETDDLLAAYYSESGLSAAVIGAALLDRGIEVPAGAPTKGDE